MACDVMQWWRHQAVK